MPAKKTPTQTEVVTVTPTLPAVTDEAWEEKLRAMRAKRQQNLQAVPSEGGQLLSFRNGVTTYMGQVVKGPIPLVLLHYIPERTYHSGAFDANNPTAPDCYSYDSETPHPEAGAPQSDDCQSCPMNAWNTGEGGRGKACKEGARFAAIHADALKSAEELQKAAIVTARLSVMNSKAFRSYVAGVEAAAGDCFSVISELTNEPDQQTQYKVSWEPKALPKMSNELRSLFLSKIEAAEAALLTPYPAFEQEAKPAKGKGRAMVPAKKAPAKGGVKRTRMQ